MRRVDVVDWLLVSCRGPFFFFPAISRCIDRARILRVFLGKLSSLSGKRMFEGWPFSKWNVVEQSWMERGLAGAGGCAEARGGFGLELFGTRPGVFVLKFLSAGLLRGVSTDGSCPVLDP